MSDSEDCGQFHLAKDYHKFQTNFSKNFSKPQTESSYLHPLSNIDKGETKTLFMRNFSYSSAVKTTSSPSYLPSVITQNPVAGGRKEVVSVRL